jgi:hypothetical protein
VKRNLIFFLLLMISSASYAQYWQQKVDYNIDVSLNDQEKTLTGFEKISYTNNSPDTLHFIWFHLWPNAYRNDRTAFSDQLLEDGNTSFYFSTKEQKGYINRLDFKVDGTAARMEDHPQHIDIVKVVLPRPLPPSGSIIITTPFHVKLPFNFSRGGFAGESFQVTQWYPKPAVYDRKGWHPMPYLNQGEFYSEFGSFDVRITLPENYVVAATGEEQTESADRVTITGEGRPKTENAKNPKTTKKPKTGTTPVKTKEPQFPPSSSTWKTVRFVQDNVHDFAWFADKRFVVDRDTLLLPSGKVVKVFNYRLPSPKGKTSPFEKGASYAKDAVRFYSAELSEYPYNTVSVVEGPLSFAGGMEYPTITIIAPTPSDKLLDLTIAHEVGHNWFYGILASNERKHPWMDEGMNSFYENKYMRRKYGWSENGSNLIFLTKAKHRTDQPIETTSEAFSEYNYGTVAYAKTAEWMALLEQRTGSEKFRELMKEYYAAWSFRHPYPEDFKAVAGKYVNDSLLALTAATGPLPGQLSPGFTIISPLKKNSVKNYISHPTKNALLLSPVIGSNQYDGFMIGGVATNYKLPPSNFQFLLAPLYATRSKELNALGKLNYSFHPDGLVRKADIFLNAAKFSMDDFKDTAGNRITMQFQKLVPGFRLTFREKDARSTVRKYLQWKTFFCEEWLSIRPDTLISGTDTSFILRYLTPKENRYVNRLQLVLENSRALYPHSMELSVDQSEDFIRPTFTANYFFNYANGGGLQFRFFAGKFIYLGEKTLSTRFLNERYHLNMTGANGYEDYTYSDYFLGRNEFEGTVSQQIMIRDGGFKVRTDLLANKVGKSDDWLAAINLSTSIPDKINPLSVLPVKIPLRVFADIGTYAEAWERNADADRFLFDAGFHLPLLNGMLNVYVPILYNRVYGDYFKSTIPKNRFLKTISFSIDLYSREAKAINRELEF